jgi:hypothetical protein
MISTKIHICVALFAVILVGCVTPVTNNIQVSAGQVAKYNDLSALDVVATLEKNVNEAKNANMELLAPSYFRLASQVLSECQSALGNKPKEVLVNYAAKGDAVLEKGRAMMAIVQYRFSKELMLNGQMEEHHTSKLLPREYEKVMSELSRLIGKVEHEQQENIDKEKDALLKQMLDLVVRSIQEGALRESEVLNADTQKKNAEAQSPVTFAEAIRIYQDAKTQIAASQHDQKLVDRLSAEALFAAHHAQMVNDRVALLQTQLGIQSNGRSPSTGNAALEKIILQEEDRLRIISTALGLNDLRDQSIDKQVEEIRRATGEVAHQPKNDANTVTAQDLESCLKAFNDSVQHELAEQADEDKQRVLKAQQLEAQAALLADKDAQIKTLKDKVDQLESVAKPSAKLKVVKPKAAKAKDPSKDQK